jgi:hypothetical protein
MPLPIDPRWPHESRLNPLERPERRWRCWADAATPEGLPGREGQR